MNSDDELASEAKSKEALLKNSMTNLLRQGMLALSLLPEHSVGGMVIITDGMLEFPDMDAVDYVLSQIRMQQFSVSFLCIGLEGDNAFGDFGFVPYSDLMQFIATTTFGAFLESASLVVSINRRARHVRILVIRIGF